MRRILFILFCSGFLLFVSCSGEIKTSVTVSLYDDLTWEQVTGESMWYKLRYFDGESVHTEYLDYGEKSASVKVSPSSLSVFALYPMGTLSPFGGFSDGGEEKNVYLLSEWGYFASMLIDAAETFPEGVARINIDALKKDNPDLGAINREVFLSSLFEGSLSRKTIKLSRKFAVPLEGVLSGYWVSLFSHSYSFTLDSTGDKETLSLLPGIWYYLNTDRNMMLEIVLTDDGEYRVKHKAKPKWS